MSAALQARLQRYLRDQKEVTAAYLAQLHFPSTGQYSTPMLGLALNGALSPDAFVGWPVDEPLTVFLLGDDAVSRLIRLSPPIYEQAPPSPADRVATALAEAVGGTLIALPSGEGYGGWLLALASHEIPILIRDFGSQLGISLLTQSAWSLRLGEPVAATAQLVATASSAWTAAEAGALTFYEVALSLARSLSAALRDRFTLQFPGTPSPSEVWLHGEDREASAVGVFVDRVVVWDQDRAQTTPITDRAGLPSLAAKVLSEVQRQRARYAEHLVLSERIRTLTESLRTQLEQRRTAPGKDGWKAVFHRVPSHHGAILGRIYYEQQHHQHEVLTVTAADGAVQVQAGLLGDGWTGQDLEGEAPTALWEAIERALATLTPEKLKIGALYEVTASIQRLSAGEVVRFLGLDDIDNHYGEYVFETLDGQRRVVAGDCSSREGNPLRYAHGHLRPR